MGRRCFWFSARAPEPFGSGKRPLAGTAGKTGAGGPCARLNTASKLFGALMLWFESTGRFCVTAWPNSDPNTPMS